MRARSPVRMVSFFGSEWHRVLNQAKGLVSRAYEFQNVEDVRLHCRAPMVGISASRRDAVNAQNEGRAGLQRGLEWYALLVSYFFSGSFLLRAFSAATSARRVSNGSTTCASI